MSTSCCSGRGALPLLTTESVDVAFEIEAKLVVLVVIAALVANKVVEEDSNVCE